jgi:4a-hydroxytetrahydrobiopterin dehydratase
MTRRNVLTKPQIQAGLLTLPGWEYRDESLHREYRFANFVQAWAFMTGCAIEAQAIDHHPNWSNVYSTVVVDLSTHDAGGVTSLDLELASKFEALARPFLPSNP